MATNDFIGFASSGSANIMSQADYAAAAEQGNGMQPGMASSKLANKVWRQGANMAAVIGELIKNHGNDALDNGDLTTLYSALLSATASPTLAGLMSPADKTKVDSVILTNATPTAAGYMSAADKTRLDSVILTNATQSAAGYMSASDKTLVDSIPDLGTFNKIFFSQTSGSYTAPRTGVYRITLKGGGGGGAGGAATNNGPRGGSGGGESGTLIMYRTLIKDTAYAYTIGAGGAGGINNIAGSDGSAGGTTSITIDGTTYSAFGGGGATSPDRSSAPGAGGTASSVSDAIAIPGAPGQPGAFFAISGIAQFAMSGGGGGAGGGNATVDSNSLAASVMGGGGAGGAIYNGVVSRGANGGDGYILVEYAG